VDGDRFEDVNSGEFEVEVTEYLDDDLPPASSSARSRMADSQALWGNHQPKAEISVTKKAQNCQPKTETSAKRSKIWPTESRHEREKAKKRSKESKERLDFEPA
jgi:hypothetical protein